MQRYDYDDDAQESNNQGRERKKKRSRRPKEDNYDEEINADYNQPSVPYQQHDGNDDDNYDPVQTQPKRKHRSKHKKRNEDYQDDEPTNNNYNYDDQMNSPEPSYDNDIGSRKPKKEKRKKPYPEDTTDNQYLNIGVRSPNYSNGSNHQYEEDENESLQVDEDPEYQEDDDNQYEDGSNRIGNASVDEQAKPKKKAGGFMKIFASFKKKNKDKKPDSKINGNQSQSTPEIFNPAYDSQSGTLEKSSKKTFSKSSRDLAFIKAHVIFLDGIEIEFDVTSKMLGKELFDKVCEYLQLEEKDFFGMTYTNVKLQTWFWLEMEKKISKQLSAGDEWVFNLQVKFYPPEPVLLQQDITRYLLSLQVRQDIFTGKLPCSWITQALLGSFMVQSELGDYDELEHGEGIEYLREFEFVRNQSDQLLEKIAELHKKHSGMTPDKADVKYLETAKRLEQYGVDLHPARDNDDVEISIGVCYQGVLIYRDRARIGRFAWPKVLRISYKKNYFYLKIRSDRYDDSVAIVGFKLFNHFLAKRLWKNAIEQHTFFRMKEPQNQKRNQRMIPSGASTYGYTGMTLHQYRSIQVSRNKPATFDRTLTKRRTIGSMPAGLEKAGMQYSSMHSLNRLHPRDMQLGKSSDHLNAKRPGSNIGINSNREGSVSNVGNRQPQFNKNPSYTPGFLYKDDDRHMSFHSGDSINAADSYIARNDDQMSLPPMSHLPQPEYARPYKKNPKLTRPSDVLSDDGYSQPIKKPISKPRQNDNLSDDMDEQPIYSKPLKKQNSKTRPNDASINIESNPPDNFKIQPKKRNSKSTRPNDMLSDDGIISPVENARQPKKQFTVNLRSNEILSDEGVNSPPENPKIKRHSSKTPRPNDLFSDDSMNSPPDYGKPLKKNFSKPVYPNDEISDDEIKLQSDRSKPLKKQSSRNRPDNEPVRYGVDQPPEVSKTIKKKTSKSSRPSENLSDDEVVPPQKNKFNMKVGGNISLPDPPVETSQSEDLDSHPKIKERSTKKPVASSNAQNQGRPQPPNHFKTPPPPPPPPMPQPRSNTSSERSSPMEHHLPPPPPPIVDYQQVSKPKPPPVKPKPALKPKPKIDSKGQSIVKASARYNDDDSNDDML